MRKATFSLLVALAAAAALAVSTNHPPDRGMQKRE